jgi:hypothetical protein
MAKLIEIIVRRFPGNAVTFDDDDTGGDNYSKMIWHEGNPDPQPTEAAIRAFSAEVDADVAAEEADRDRDRRFAADIGPGTQRKIILALALTLDRTIEALPANIQSNINRNPLDLLLAALNRTD